MWKDYSIVFTKKNQNSFHKIILLQYPFVNHEYCNKGGRGGGFKVMVYNTTFNNISVILAVSFIGGGNQSTRRKPPTCRK